MTTLSHNPVNGKEMRCMVRPGYDDYISIRGSETYIMNRPLHYWTEKYHMPLHLTFKPAIRRNINNFKNVLDRKYPRYLICYAAKACSHPAVFNLMRENNIGVDATSMYELKGALDAGISCDKIVLNGNSKDNKILKTAIERNILIIVDNLHEFDFVSGLALEMKRKTRVIIRVSGFSMDNVTDSCIFTSGAWTKFGININEIPGILARLDSFPGIEVAGFHMHVGSQIADLEPYLTALGKLIELGHLLESYGRKCEIINIGGGFPLSYVNEDEWNYILDKTKKGIISFNNGDSSELFIWDNESCGYKKGTDGTYNFDEWIGEKFHTPYPKEKLLEAILENDITVSRRKVNTIAALKELKEPLLIIEPGRAVIGDAGITLSRVGFINTINKHHNMISVEMGVVNYAGSVIHKLINRWDIINDFSRKEERPFDTFVCGQLCYNGDIICRYKTSLQRKPVRGDILITYDTGATEAHFFASNANSFARPARVLIDENGNEELLKKRDSYKDIFYTG